MAKEITLGSLFDGSGGFPLAAALYGAVPLWAAEVEPYPIAVTRSRFPNMRHLGDVSKVHGGDITPVDIITFGSPCQDMSVAGKRAGMKHKEYGAEETTRSGLFYEAVRIIREMREATNGEYPTFAVWENVPGAFSSNKGADFQCVLEALAGAAQGEAVTIPEPPNWKWEPDGHIAGDGWSIAWTVLDAQNMGVPQRRKRIYLVTDFRDQRAGEILFKRESLPRYFAAGRSSWKGTSEDTARGIGGSDIPCYCLQGNGIDRADTAGCNGRGRSCGGDTLNTVDRHAVCYPSFYQNTGIGWWNEGEIAETLRTPCGGDSTKANVVVMATAQANAEITCDKAPTIMAEHEHPILALDCRNMKANEEMSATLQAHNGGGYSLNYQNPVVYQTIFHTLGAMNARNPESAMKPNCVCLCYDARGNGNGETAPTIIGDHNHRISDYTAVVEEAKEVSKYQRKYIVRRLTPLECGRLQGFPDGWGVPDVKNNMTDEEAAFWEHVRKTHAEITGKKYSPCKTREALLKWYNGLRSDGAEYKMWGNGIALPCASFVVGGCVEKLMGDDFRQEFPWEALT